MPLSAREKRGDEIFHGVDFCSSISARCLLLSCPEVAAWRPTRRRCSEKLQAAYQRNCHLIFKTLGQLKRLLFVALLAAAVQAVTSAGNGRPEPNSGLPRCTR